MGRVHAGRAHHARDDGLDGRRGGSPRRWTSRSPPCCRSSPSRCSASRPLQGPAALRRGRDLPLHGRLHHRARHRALGARPAHRVLHAAPGRRAPGRDRRRLHGGHRVPEHVGLEYRVRGHDGADRVERHRPRAAQPHRDRPQGVRRDTAGPHSRAQFRHRPAAVRRLRGFHRRDRDHHRLAAQRHRRALHPADVPEGGELLRLAADRRAVHAHLPADRVVDGHPRAVSLRHGRDRGRPATLRRRVSQARPALARREDRAGRLFRHRLPLDIQPAAQGRCRSRA